MRVLNAVQRTVMLLLLVPVAAICCNVILRMLGAQRANPIVSVVRRIANFFILPPFTDVFPKQSYVEDAAVALVGYGLIALLAVGVFKFARAIVAARPPVARSKAPRPGPGERAQDTQPAEPAAGSGDTTP